MYLDDITRSWRAFVAAAGFPGAADAQITNTAKLTGLAGGCLLELERDGRRYHCYYLPGYLPGGSPAGEPDLHLHRLDEDYGQVGIGAVFGLDEVRAAALGDAVGAFLRQHYGGVQTAVDGRRGLARAKAHIRAVRLAQWRPAD